MNHASHSNTNTRGARIPSDPNRDKDEDLENMRYRHRRLCEIWINTKMCQEQLEHEPTWNSEVHSPVLSEALCHRTAVRHRNLYALPSFLQPSLHLNPFLLLPESILVYPRSGVFCYAFY